jgi:hypothetical protein
MEAAELLCRDGVSVSVLSQPVALFEDSNGYLHSEPRCWGASKIVRVDVAELADLPDAPRCECRGWVGTPAALALDEAGWMYSQLEANAGTECVDLGRWLNVSLQPLRNSELLELHTRVLDTAAAHIKTLREIVRTRAAMEGIAAQAVTLTVTPDEGPALRHWAQSMLLTETEQQRRWLDDRFYTEFSEKLYHSERVRVVMACRIGSQTPQVLLQAVSGEVLEKDGYWIGHGCVPALVAAGMNKMTGSGGVAVVLETTDHRDVWRTAAGLWQVRGELSNLHEVVEIARAIHARDQLQEENDECELDDLPEVELDELAEAEPS